MTDSILELSRFATRGLAAQAAVDVAISRADLVRLVHRRRRELAERQKDLEDATLRLAMAEAGLAELDEGRAPA